MKTILVVDDEIDILDLVEYTLSKVGFDVIGCTDTSRVQQILDEEKVNLIIMDRNLPGTEGTIFVQSLRADGYTQPVIYLSAKDSEDDILEGFDRGGDDYITKPFSLNLLVARVKAILKRGDMQPEQLSYRDIKYNANNKKIYISNQEIALTRLERELLLYFLNNQNILFSRDTLLEKVWNDTGHTNPKTVNVAIKRLKEKIDPSGEKRYIQAVRGEGYILC